jgi:hypothetical protein
MTHPEIRNRTDQPEPSPKHPGRRWPERPEPDPGGVAFVDARSRVGERAGLKESRADRAHPEMGSRRQGQRLGQSRPADGGSDPRVDGPDGVRNSTDKSGSIPPARHRTALGSVPRERRLRSGALGAHHGRSWVRLAESRSHPIRRRTGRSCSAAEHRARGGLWPSTNGPRLVPLRGGAPAVADRLCERAAVVECPAPGFSVDSSPGSARRLFRNSARGRSAVGPYSASRSRPATWRLDRSGARAPTRAQSWSELLPSTFIDNCGISRLSTAEKGRLHVLGGHPPHDTAGRPLVTPAVGTAPHRRRVGR